MSGKTVYLSACLVCVNRRNSPHKLAVSGANRGIGYGIAIALAARPKTIVVAGARDPTAPLLKELISKHSNVHPVKLTSGEEADNQAAIAEIHKKVGQLDIVIANAGVSKHYGPLASTPLSEFRDHWEVNTLGTVVLFQAAHKLLLASPTAAPKFEYISSLAGSIANYTHIGAAAYGSSKAAANFLIRVFDTEYPSLIAMAIYLGWVATDIGNVGAVMAERNEAPVTVEDSVSGIMSRVDGGTKEKSSGRFWNFKATNDGDFLEATTDEIPWYRSRAVIPESSEFCYCDVAGGLFQSYGATHTRRASPHACRHLKGEKNQNVFMAGKTIYLISGANRGIGYGLTAALAARPNTIVFAGARDCNAPSLKELTAKHSNVHPVKFTSGDRVDNEAAIAEIQKTAGQLDVVIANAGVCKYYGPLATTPLSEFREHWEVNTLGMVVLFQAAHKLLLASPTGVPKFVYISSGAGSIGNYIHIGAPVYGSSKAAANFLVKVLDTEHPSLIAMAISPGFVATDMGNLCAVNLGLLHAPVKMEDSVPMILSRVDRATKEKSSGRFWNALPTTDGNLWDFPTDELAW
ncbi:hypothetical protein K438DRAFT_1757209 [Mycena galopus ATCC 62051]|nr:hypothetical protein K438DRAFT_1757209 [Mycena galopus ATCC 62051]